MVWFVILQKLKKCKEFKQFQTKLTYGMICYVFGLDNDYYEQLFQTKLTYGMICYSAFYN